jgi:hypothetical protein
MSVIGHVSLPPSRKHWQTAIAVYFHRTRSEYNTAFWSPEDMRLLADLSQQRPGFDSTPVREGFVVDNVAKDLFVLQSFRF